MLTVGSLFSGIGGLDLGLERAGMRVIWQSEIDSYACKVLAKHWPEVPNHGDIKKIDWQQIERPDVICGGYPCQPFSKAGKRRGEEDPRHLWPWVRDAISALRPRYAVLENVRGHLSMGGTTVIGELASIGYNAEWRIVSANSMGAPHLRERVIIVAYPNGRNTPNGGQCENVSGFDRGRTNDKSGGDSDTWQVSVGGARETTATLAYAGGERRLHTRHEIFSTETRQQALSKLAIGSWWATEPDVGRVAHGVPSRVDRLRGLGNAVVPQVAEVIGRLVTQHAGY